MHILLFILLFIIAIVVFGLSVVGLILKAIFGNKFRFGPFTLSHRLQESATEILSY